MTEEESIVNSIVVVLFLVFIAIIVFCVCYVWFRLNHAEEYQSHILHQSTIRKIEMTQTQKKLAA